MTRRTARTTPASAPRRPPVPLEEDPGSGLGPREPLLLPSSRRSQGFGDGTEGHGSRAPTIVDVDQ